MSAVGKVIGKVGGAIFGGDSKAVQGGNFDKMTPEEQARLKGIEAQINSIYGNQSNQNAESQAQASQITQLFQDQLKQFLTGGSSNPNPTPEQVQSATNFIDQTFTNPAQTQLNQQQADFQSQAQAKAAALGRNPNADIATQQAIAGEAMRQGQGLQSERGARIAQASREFNDVGYNRGLQGLNVGMQGSGFLNQLGQQAFQNRLGLLNARSGLADFYQRERGKTTTNQSSTSPGILGTLNSGVGQVAGTVANIGKIGSMF